MPQMSPMDWFMLMTYFLFIYMLIILYIYYIFKNYIKVMGELNNNLNFLSLKWF